MTTVAANRSEMAADSQGTRDSGLVVSRSEAKVVRLAGDIVACQGTEDQIALFEDWYEGGRDPGTAPTENLEDQFAALALTPEGRIFKWFRLCVPCEVFEDFIAFGSG